MASLTFSTENLIALNKLEASVRRESGERHILSDKHSLLKLIDHASASNSVKVQQAFLHFVRGLSSDQQSELIYRGVAVSKERGSSEASADQGERRVERTYRGVSTGSKVAEASSNSGKAAGHKKPVRVYRGRVVTD